MHFLDFGKACYNFSILKLIDTDWDGLETLLLLWFRVELDIFASFK